MSNWLLAFVMTAFCIEPLIAYSQVQLEFEVASVKLRRPGAIGTDGILVGCHGTDTVYPAGLPLTPPPLGRCILKNNLRGLIKSAYSRDEHIIGDIIGGPQWLNSQEFDIEAKAEKPTDEDSLYKMLRSLLEDRFKLRFHREERVVDGLALVVSKNGHKLKPSADSYEPMLEALKKNRGGVYKGWTMRRFVDDLRRRLGVPVADKTGLTGSFDFLLNVENNLDLARAALDPELIQQLGNDSGTSLVTALEDQLGLKLVGKQKVQVDVIVVDHAELPEH